MAEQYSNTILLNEKKKPSPNKKDSSPKKQQIVVIEQTPDGPVKHIFYGDVQVLSEAD
jgi:hypothetical protein